MRDITFNTKKENGLFVNSLFYDHFDNPLIEKSWDGLFENESYENKSKSPYFNFGINNNLYEDNIILSTLIWRLIKDRKSFGIPNYYRDEAREILKKDFEYINWEYNLVYEYNLSEPKDNGFIIGRSCVPINPEPDELQKKYKNFAGLFEIETYSDIIGLEIATFGDATAEISFFGLVNNDKAFLKSKLTATERPDLTSILSGEDIFIDLVIGHDQGYFTCLHVYSKIDISEQIKTVTTDLYNKCKLYEDIIENIKNIDEFNSEMKKINSY